MYFDHVRCPACNAQFNPEQIDSKGGVARCPSCNTQLGVASMFGVADAFVGVGDDEGIGLTLDDAVQSQPQPGSRPAQEPAPAPEEGETNALALLRKIRKDRS